MTHAKRNALKVLARDLRHTINLAEKRDASRDELALMIAVEHIPLHILQEAIATKKRQSDALRPSDSSEENIS